MNKPCATCGGTGEIGYFQGVSRFLLTREECPDCCGTGLSEEAAEDRAGARRERKGENAPVGRRKKRR